MLKEFKEFAVRGNVMDMAVGIVIGVAFGKIVTSLVNDVIMPPVGLLLGDVDFTELYVNLTDVEYASLSEAQEAGAATINYGIFFTHVLDFLIVAVAIFLAIRQINRLKKHEEEAVPTEGDCPFCLSKVPLKATRCAHCTSELEAT